MAPADPVDGISPPPRFDPDSEQWVRVLSGTGPQRETGLARLHELLLRIARTELRRRSGQIFEVSAKLGRHFWAYPAVPMDTEDWDRLPDRFGPDPARETERRELADAVRRAVDEQLTPRQRQVFVALVHS